MANMLKTKRNLLAALAACSLVSACAAPGQPSIPRPLAMALITNDARVGYLENWRMAVVADQIVPPAVVTSCYADYGRLVRSLPSSWMTEEQALVVTDGAEVDAGACAARMGYAHAAVRVIPADRISHADGVSFREYEKSLSGLDRRGDRLMQTLARLEGPMAAASWSWSIEESRRLHGGRYGCGRVENGSVIRLEDGLCSGWKSRPLTDLGWWHHRKSQ